jgi:hypothetical protein
MNVSREQDWITANQRLLCEELERLRRLLRRHAAAHSQDQAADEPTGDCAPPGRIASTLDYLCRRFELSAFERDLLLLVAGAELESAFAPLCAAAQGDPRKDYPTFSLAFAALPDAHWSALAPQAPLRRWQLIDIRDGPSLTTARLVVNERILHFLLGVDALDTRLAPFVRTLAPPPLAASQLERARELCALWEHGRDRVPTVRLVGEDLGSLRGVVAHACAQAGRRALALRTDELPGQIEERTLLAHLLSRECVLQPAVVVVETGGDHPLHAAFMDALQCPRVLIGGGAGAALPRCLTLEVPRPSLPEAAALWRCVLGDHDSPAGYELDRLIAHFDLSAGDIVAAAAQARHAREQGGSPAAALWHACRVQARGALDTLARRIEPRARWHDLVLPAQQLALLHELARQVRHRVTVYERWGFGSRGARGLGVSALFAGDSGTGKTLAGEVLAGELELDLYRIDLSAVVSKYIGETEKNLRRVFDTAEASGAVLLFDEADALFGRRSEVKDSHDRYANIELAYLLQRMESYRGLAILTTNMRSLLDAAFLRRVRFVVHFPFPDVHQRAAIWQRVIPEAAPRQDVCMKRLARLNVAGGNIRNIAVNAAFLAADEGEALAMRHLLHAARIECAKLDKPLTAAEVGGWQ